MTTWRDGYYDKDGATRCVKRWIQHWIQRLNQMIRQLFKHPLSYLRNDGEQTTTLNQLIQVLHTTSRVVLYPCQYPKFDIDMDEVYTDVYIGDAGAARDKTALKRYGITHVLNTAEGNRFGMVNTSQGFYQDSGIKYMGLKLIDIPSTNIGVHFHDAANFIDEALSTGGKVLVHCLMGVSRSSTCVLAFLMLKRGMSASQAIEKVRKHREVRPNDGFLEQLASLDNKLRRERLRQGTGPIPSER